MTAVAVQPFDLAVNQASDLLRQFTWVDKNTGLPIADITNYDIVLVAVDCDDNEIVRWSVTNGKIIIVDGPKAVWRFNVPYTDIAAILPDAYPLQNLYYIAPGGQQIAWWRGQFIVEKGEQ